LETSSELQAVSHKERFKLVLKFALVGVVFWFLFKKGLVTAESFHQLMASPFTIFVMVLLMSLNTILGTLRWRGLLAAKDAYLSFKRVFELNIIGSFFNIALPGAVSGDFVKAVYVSKQFPEKRAAVFGSMLLDRFLGMAAMIFVGAVSAFLSRFINWGGSLPSVLLYSVGGLGFGILLFLFYMFLSHKKDPLFDLIQFITKRHTRLQLIDKLYIGVMDYRSRPRAVILAVLQSIVIHTLLVLIAFSISEAVSITPISLVALAVIVPIGMLATTIPVLPAGVGTGHAAFFALFKLVGSNQGAEIFSLIVMMQIVVGVVGGAIYLRTTARDALLAKKSKK
jgi:uncharacterized protein (TIRG00374 family)